MHETGFAQSWSIGASLGLKIFHCTPVVCEDFSRMLISRSPRVRLIMQPSLLVKLPDFIFGIPNKHIIETNSHLTSAGKHGTKLSPSLQKRRFAEVIPYHSIHIGVTSQYSADVTLTLNITCVIKIMRAPLMPKIIIVYTTIRIV